MHDPDDRCFLGHPRGLAYLSFTQVWERFSYYGMQALLTLYMIHQLLTPGHVETVIGFGGFHAAIETVFGPLTRLALASQIFGLYAGLMYITPLLGGWLGDRVLGQRLTTVIGLVLMAAGHLLMTSEAFFLIALLLLVTGAGCIKGNMYAQVGNLYAAGDGRRTFAFSIFLIGLNIGAFVAPLVCGTLGEVYGWHYGFGVAGLGMLIGLATYVSGWRYLPPDRSRDPLHAAPTAFGQREWRATGAVLLSLVPPMILGSALFQAYNLVIVWAETQVDRNVGGWTMPVTWLFAFDGLLTIAGILATFLVWRWLARRRRSADTMQNLVISSSLMTLAYAMLAGGAGAAGGALVPLAIVLLFFVALDLGYAFLEPPVNAFVSRVAPVSISTTLMSVTLMAIGGVPNLIVGWMGRFYEPLGPTAFWWLHAGIAAGGGVAALTLRPVIAQLASDTPLGGLAMAR